MSGPDDNKDIRDFIADGGNLHTKYSIRVNPELFAVPHGDIVPIKNEKTISYRKLLSSSFQTFNTGDVATNEDLLSDWTTADDRYDFGIWFLKENGIWEKMIDHSNEIFVNMNQGNDKEIKISELINNIMLQRRKKTKRCEHFIFHFANCSPITLKKNKNKKLQKIGSIWKRKGHTYKRYPDEYWYNKLFLIYKRILYYSIGKENSKKKKSEEYSGAGAEAELYGESTPSRMNEEERAEMYAHFDEWKKLYNKFSSGTKEEKKKAAKMRDIYKYVIAACTTPYHDKTNMSVNINSSIVPIYGTSQVTLKKKLPSGEIIHPTDLHNSLLKIYNSKVKSTRKKITNIPKSKMMKKYIVNTNDLEYNFPWLTKFYPTWDRKININRKVDENTREYYERIAYQIWMFGESTFEYAGTRLLNPNKKIIPDEFEEFVYKNAEIKSHWKNIANKMKRNTASRRRSAITRRNKTLKKSNYSSRHVRNKSRKSYELNQNKLKSRNISRSRSRSRSRNRSRSRSSVERSDTNYRSKTQKNSKK